MHHSNTPRDLFSFYQKVIDEIRIADTITPLMVESGFYAQPPAKTECPSIENTLSHLKNWQKIMKFLLRA